MNQKQQQQQQEQQQRETDAAKQILAQAMKLLARREHSRAELALKLLQRGYEQPAIAAALDECEARHWLDDERFAEIYVRQRREVLYGPMRILAELQRRGIDVEPPSLAAVTEAEWRASAVRVREKKFGLAGRLDWNERGRQGRFLASRGFAMSQIEHALDQVRQPD